MESERNELRKLIDAAQTAYDTITEQWKRSECFVPLNLKKETVSSIAAETTVYAYILDCVEFLNAHSAEISLQLISSCTALVTTRVKTQNSIAFKIDSYSGEKHQNGKIPINKCLNDLFGVRIILEEATDFPALRAFFEETYPQTYKYIDSSKQRYRAVHLYFRADNQSFPWELQIWNRCDAETNFESHKEYKQAYTIWEQNRKEGSL